MQGLWVQDVLLLDFVMVELSNCVSDDNGIGFVPLWGRWISKFSESANRLEAIKGVLIHCVFTCLETLFLGHRAPLQYREQQKGYQQTH